MVVHMPSGSIELPADEIARITRPIVERIVFATVATVSPTGRIRTRVMHPVWFWDGATPEALVSARRTPLKVAHIGSRSEVSCSYWDPAHETVTIEAMASWVDEDAIADAWRRVASVDPPVGFDPAIIWPDGPAGGDCGFLHLRAHRIRVTSGGLEPRRWARAVEPQ